MSYRGRYWHVMRKKTHVLIAKEVADHLGIVGRERYEFIFGALYPDLVPTVFIKPHTWRRWHEWAERHLTQGNAFHRGCALHFLCDFYTRPHNVKGFVSYKHMCWEGDLLRYFKAHHVIWGTGIPLEQLRCKYLSTMGGVETDWKFCCLALSQVYGGS